MKVKSFTTEKMKNLLYSLFFALLSVLLLSCDSGAGIEIRNNSNISIVLEYKTIYDSISDGVEEHDWGRNIYLDSKSGYFSIKDGPLEIKPNGSEFVILRIGGDIIAYLGLGTVRSMDDVIHAIDYIFTEINVYAVVNEEKKLLYEKDYFLDKRNIQIKNRWFSMIINPKVSGN